MEEMKDEKVEVNADLIMADAMAMKDIMERMMSFAKQMGAGDAGEEGNDTSEMMPAMDKDARKQALVIKLKKAS